MCKCIWQVIEQLRVGGRITHSKLKKDCTWVPEKHPKIGSGTLEMWCKSPCWSELVVLPREPSDSPCRAYIVVERQRKNGPEEHECRELPALGAESVYSQGREHWRE